MKKEKTERRDFPKREEMSKRRLGLALISSKAWKGEIGLTYIFQLLSLNEEMELFIIICIIVRNIYCILKIELTER